MTFADDVNILSFHSSRTNTLIICDRCEIERARWVILMRSDEFPSWRSIQRRIKLSINAKDWSFGISLINLTRFFQSCSWICVVNQLTWKLRKRISRKSYIRIIAIGELAAADQRRLGSTELTRIGSDVDQLGKILSGLTPNRLTEYSVAQSKKLLYGDASALHRLRDGTARGIRSLRTAVSSHARRVRDSRWNLYRKGLRSR